MKGFSLRDCPEATILTANGHAVRFKKSKSIPSLIVTGKTGSIVKYHLSTQKWFTNVSKEKGGEYRPLEASGFWELVDWLNSRPAEK